MTDHHAALRDFRRSRDYFVGIDSDGCAFDTMELKHKECFIPNIVYHYGLQAASKYARETAEFVNLYSRWRGTNRFPALVMTIDLLRERPEVVRRGVPFPDMEPLRRFVESGKPLGNPSLAEEASAGGDPQLERALRWSEAVNADVARMVHGVAPFPGVRDCLERLEGTADRMVVSATPVEALTAEWEEHDLARHVALIAGQEVGSKRDTLRTAAGAGYPEGHVLMIGDSPGDMKAARANDALFFPVVPGDEEASWARLRDEALDRFLGGTYAGSYEEGLVEGFLAKLPGTPPWKA